MRKMPVSNGYSGSKFSYIKTKAYIRIAFPMIPKFNIFQVKLTKNYAECETEGQYFFFSFLFV